MLNSFGENDSALLNFGCFFGGLGFDLTDSERLAVLDLSWCF